MTATGKGELEFKVERVTASEGMNTYPDMCQPLG